MGLLDRSCVPCVGDEGVSDDVESVERNESAGIVVSERKEKLSSRHARDCVQMHCVRMASLYARPPNHRFNSPDVTFLEWPNLRGYSVERTWRMGKML